MKNAETIKYVVLAAVIATFLTLVYLLVNNHLSGRDNEEIINSQADQLLEDDDEFVSEVFDDEGFGDEFNTSDPFEKYCKGNEGAISSFTICAPN